MKRATTSSSLLFLAAALLATACGPSFVLSTPPGFIELDQKYSSYDYRATTADGVVIAAREIDNDRRGELGFWVRAIENRMRERGGYALLESKAVKSADGIEGRQLRFGHDDQAGSAVSPQAQGTGSARPHLYYLTIFVTEDKIFLLEVGGTKELVTSQAAAVDSVIASFHTGT
jgi:hypothetical protein